MTDNPTPEQVAALSDPELDALVATEVMGWNVGDGNLGPQWRNSKGHHMFEVGEGYPTLHGWRPTHDATQAMAALRSSPWFYDMMSSNTSEMESCYLSGKDGYIVAEADCSTLERAICEALAVAGARTVQEKEPPNDQRRQTL